MLAQVNRRLKHNKALESCKINGLLFLSLDANECFHSRSRCCPTCCQRELEETDDQGHKHPVIEYYHRYVFAQINEPTFNVLLDGEPIRPGEGEAEAALRLLGRLCRLYGVRFFDAVTVDSWYVQGPFLKAVEKLGWGWMVVLKQERMEVLQEARALTAGQKPLQEFYDEERQRVKPPGGKVLSGPSFFAISPRAQGGCSDTRRGVVACRAGTRRFPIRSRSAAPQNRCPNGKAEISPTLRNFR